MAHPLTDVWLTAGRTVVHAVPAGGGLRVSLDDGSVREADHLLLATGYRVDIARYPFFPPGCSAPYRPRTAIPGLAPAWSRPCPGCISSARRPRRASGR